MGRKSVFDGWKKQIRGDYSDYQGGYCAMGWLCHSIERDSIVDSIVEHLAAWIIQNLDFGIRPGYSPEDIVIWANDKKGLTIEDFKRIDLETDPVIEPEIPVDCKHASTSMSKQNASSPVVETQQKEEEPEMILV